ncbi:MAG: hypothetical protein OEV64_13405, partial [Desulfobulbaceae bacterium]|nr:hypothetical protein [Desulfobulbaceae bacterium]
MIRVDMDITLRVRGPILTKSSAPGNYGLDECVARNSKGEMYIPASHVSGKLREAWEELADCLDDSASPVVPTKNQILELLGQASFESPEPRSKKLIFSDFILQAGQNEQCGVGHRIRIDPQMGAVQKGALLSLESPFGPGASITFSGRLSFYATGPGEAATLRLQLLRGLQWIPQLGGMRSIGFGVLEDVSVAEPVINRVELQPRDWRQATGFDIVLQPFGPFCISTPTPVDNLFESEEVIPGNVILGMLASALNGLEGHHGRKVGSASGQSKFSVLREHFSKIRITHAFPTADPAKRPIPPPQSLVKVGDNTFDVALLDTPCLINGKPPEFQIDWKDGSKVYKQYGWPTLTRELRVRTAMDPESLRSAEEKLFAYNMVVPEDHRWTARVDLCAIEDEKTRNTLMDQLSALFTVGLLGLGKTKTPVDVTIHGQGTIADVMPSGDIEGLGPEQLLIITLRTPALLCSAKNLNEESGGRELRTAYEETWQALCPDLQLVRYFARQSLAGGEYLRARFQGDRYLPWLLTEAGAVFVFRVENWEAANNQ